MEQAPASNQALVGSPLRFWSRWVLANCAGGVAGGALGGLASYLLFSLSFGESSAFSSLALIFVVLPWFTALLIGLVLGVAQWLVLRTIFPNTRSNTGVSWVLITGGSSAGAVLVTGAVAYSALSTLLVPFTLAEVSPITPGGAASIPGLAAIIVGGATIGLAQWIVLQNYVRRAHWWVLANAAGWLFGVVISGLIAGMGNNWTVAAYSSLGSGPILQTTVVAGITSLVIGGVTGIMLIWLIQPRSDGVLAPRIAAMSILLIAVTMFASLYTNYVAANPEGQSAKFQMSARVRSVAFSPDGNFVAAGDENYTIDVWRVADGGRVFTIAGSKPGQSEQESRQAGYTMAAWSPDGRYLATTSNQKEQAIRIWDTSTWRTVFTSTIPPNATQNAQGQAVDLPTSVPGMAWSPDGSKLAVIIAGTESCCDDRTPDWSEIRVFSMPEGEIYETLIYPASVWSLAWAPDGSKLALGVFNLFIDSGGSALNKVFSWNLVEGGGQANDRNTTTIIEAPVGAVSLDWGPDANLIAVGIYGQGQRIWDLSKQAFLDLPDAHERTVNWVAWSPGGQLLATASSDLTAKIIDVANGEIVATFNHPRWVTSIDWSPDGSQVVTGSDDGGVRLWDVPRPASH